MSVEQEFLMQLFEDEELRNRFKANPKEVLAARN